MRSFIFLGILVVFFGLLQASFFFDVLAIEGVRPDLLLILIAFIAFKKGSFHGQFVGFGAGLFQQFFSRILFGTYAFVFTVVGFVLGLSHRKVDAENFLTAIVIGFLATLLKGLVLGVLAIFFGDVFSSTPFATYLVYLRNGLLIELIYNPLVAAPVFWLLNRFAAPLLR